MQAEKTLRDAGWVETVYGDLGKDDEFSTYRPAR